MLWRKDLIVAAAQVVMNFQREMASDPVAMTVQTQKVVGLAETVDRTLMFAVRADWIVRMWKFVGQAVRLVRMPVH